MDNPKILFVNPSNSRGRLLFEAIKSGLSYNIFWISGITEIITFLKDNPDVRLIIFDASQIPGENKEQDMLSQDPCYHDSKGTFIQPFALHGGFIKKNLPNTSTVLITTYGKLQKQAEGLGIVFIQRVTHSRTIVERLKEVLKS